MSVGTNNSIITDGLIFSVDSYNRKSYVSGSTTTSNLVKNDVINATLINGTGFDDKGWSFDGTNQYIKTPSANEFMTGLEAFTWESWSMVTSGSTGGYICCYNIPTLYSGPNMAVTTGAFTLYNYNVTGSNWSRGRYIFPTALEIGQWIHTIVSWDGSDTYKMWVNGESVIPVKTVTGTPPTEVAGDSQSQQVEFRIGASLTSITYGGLISKVNVYNKVFTDQEAKQNYNALKYRFI